MEKLNRYSKRLLKVFRELQFTDILGFGNILGVNDNQDFDDYLTNIIVKFEEQPLSKKKSLLQLAKDVAAANKELSSDPNLLIKAKG